jgi:hypothetical protein
MHTTGPHYLWYRQKKKREGGREGGRLKDFWLICCEFFPVDPWLSLGMQRLFRVGQLFFTTILLHGYVVVLLVFSPLKNLRIWFLQSTI